MSFRISCPQNITEQCKNYLKQQGFEVVVRTTRSGAPENYLEAADCDAVIAQLEPYGEKEIDACNKLRMISRTGVGFDKVDIAYAAKRGIYVGITPNANINSVAEHAMYLILSSARLAGIVGERFRNGDFYASRHIFSTELSDTRLGLLGFGRIGRLLTKKAALGMDMKVSVYDPYVDPASLPEYVTWVHEQDEIFKESDFISLHMPLTEQTRHSIGKREFELMKPTAYFINTSRGELIVEEDLISALTQKRIRGAGIDVFDPEPPSSDNPLLTMQNVIVTPHTAALTKKSFEAMMYDAAVNINEFFKTGKPKWAVNEPNGDEIAKRSRIL